MVILQNFFLTLNAWVLNNRSLLFFTDESVFKYFQKEKGRYIQRLQPSLMMSPVGHDVSEFVNKLSVYALQVVSENRFGEYCSFAK